MIDGLVSAHLFGKPAKRTGPSGKKFVTCKVRAATGGENEAMFVNVIAFTNSAQAALLALDDGDSVALTGPLTPKVWTDKTGAARPGLDMVAHAVLTAYHAQRKRRAVAEASETPPGQPGRATLAPKHRGLADLERLHGDGARDMDDDLTDVRF